MKKAVLYLRISKQEQTQNSISLDIQEKVCREFAKENNCDVDTIFTDIGYGGKKTSKPKLQEMLKYCKNKDNDVHAIIVFRLDRLTRNFGAFFREIFPILEKNSIYILSATEKWNSNSLFIGSELQTDE